MDEEKKYEGEEQIKAEDSFLSLFLDPIIDQALKEVVITPQNGSAPPEIKAEETEVKENYKHFLTEQLYCHQERLRNILAFDIIAENLNRVTNPEQCALELKRAGITLRKKLVHPLIAAETKQEQEQVQQEMWEGLNESGVPDFPQTHIPRPTDRFHTVMEEVGISEDVYQSIYQIAKSLVKEDNVEDAICVFQWLTRLNTTSHEAWYGLALCHQILQEWDEAITHFTIATVSDESNLQAFFCLAECHLKVGEKGQAREVMNLVLQTLEDLEMPVEEKESWAQRTETFKQERC